MSLMFDGLYIWPFRAKHSAFDLVDGRQRPNDITNRNLSIVCMEDGVLQMTTLGYVQDYQTTTTTIIIISSDCCYNVHASLPVTFKPARGYAPSL